MAPLPLYLSQAECVFFIFWTPPSFCLFPGKKAYSSYSALLFGLLCTYLSLLFCWTLNNQKASFILHSPACSMVSERQLGWNRSRLTWVAHSQAERNWIEDKGSASEFLVYLWEHTSGIVFIIPGCMSVDIIGEHDTQNSSIQPIFE